MSLCGVDVGGTFTDVVYFDDETGAVEVAKVRSSHPIPDVAVLQGIGGIGPGDHVAGLSCFVHGTTVGLNALIEGRGPKLAILATKGFRDVLELRRCNQTEDPYNLFWKPRPPIVPRARRFGIGGRIDHSGEEIVPVDVADVYEAARICGEEQVEGVIVALINAYANPRHELQIADVLAEAGFGGEITLSHEISREYREFERTSTAVVNGFIRPHVSAYLERLESGLSEAGFDGQSLITRSGGGSLSFVEGQRRPFETLLSGPVAGVEGACFLGTRSGHERVITADVGGTSFDTAFILGGKPQIKNQGEIIGLPIQSPWVDVRSIGAGGGSIAHIGTGGLLHVGPRSAGSDPGPACYGNGGTEPTVTDAAVHLGMLPVSDLGDTVSLDASLATAALEPLATSLSLTVDDLAAGIIRIATTGMADAIREITVESGEDPRTAVLVAYGGAGPLFATPLADELDIHELIIPPHAGVFSAWGLMVTDAVQVRSRTKRMRLDEESMAEVGSAVAEMLDEIVGNEAESGERDQVAGASLDLRYMGQEHSLTIPLEMRDREIESDFESVRDDFVDKYQRRFDIALNAEVEIVACRAEIRRSLAGEIERIVEAGIQPNGKESSTTTRRAFSMRLGEWCDFEIHQRAEIGAGLIEGPAIVVEGTTTTYVDHGFSASLGDMAEIRLTLQGNK